MAYQATSNGLNLNDAIAQNTSGIAIISGQTIIDGILSTTSDGAPTRIYIDTYNSSNTFGSSLRGRRHRGTKDTPSGVLKDDILLQVVGDGYHGSGYEMATASMVIFAAEDFVSGKHGSYIKIRTTPIGSNSQLERLYISNNGNIGISNSNPNYTLDISGSGNFSQNVYSNGLLLATQSYVNNVSGAIVLSSNQSGLTQQSADLLYYQISNPQQYIKSGEVIGIYVLKSDTGNFISTSQTGQFYPNSNPNNFTSNLGFLTNLSGLSTGYVTGISGNLQLQINNITNGTGQFVNGSIISGYITTGNADNRYYLNSNPQNYSTSGNIANTGQNLISYINNNSATINNLALTGSNLQSQILNITNNTGNFYLNSNTQQFIRSGDVISTYSTIVNLQSTGSILDNKINSLSGYSNNNFVTNNILNNFGVKNINGVSGNLTLSGINNIGISLSGSSTIFISGIDLTTATNLGLTGSSLDLRITSLSGYSNNTFATIINLASTGSQTLTSSINNAINLSGNLQSTGSVLNNKINLLSGYWSNNPSGYISQLNLGNVVTGISVSGGQSITGIFNITAGANITLTQNGTNSLSIAGAIGAGEANTASNLGNGSGFFAQKSVVDLQFKSIKAGSSDIFITGSSTELAIGFNGLYITPSQTGQFYASSNPQQYSTSGNLSLTGSILDSKINVLSGYSNSTFATVANLAITGQQNLLIANNNSINLSGNLQITGSSLDNKINSLSGYSNSNFVGNSWGVKTVNNVSGNLNIFGINNIGISISGNSTIFVSGIDLATATNLGTTGSILNNNIIGLSGILTGNYLLKSQTGQFYPISNPQNYASSGQFISGISITGGLAIQGSLNINAGNNIILTQQGLNTFSIASSAVGISSGPSITGISVTGGDPVTGLFNIIQGSNITLTQLGVSGILIAGSAGEANTASNVGNGIGIFAQKSSVDLQFNSIIGGTGINVSISGNTILVNSLPKKFIVDVDFGFSNSGQGDIAYITMSGISGSWVTNNTIINCCPMGTSTINHSGEDVVIEGIEAYGTNINPGIGFDVVAYAPLGTHGIYKIGVICNE